MSVRRTGKKIIPLIDEAAIPLVGIFSGAQLFRDPPQPYIFTIRPFYYQEAAAIVTDIINRQKLTKVAILYQYDDFGFDGLKGTEIALAEHNMRPVITASYERNTDAIDGALETIRSANPEAVIMVAVYNPAIKFITRAKALGFNPVFVSMSFVGPEAFAHGLGADGEGTIVSQTIPPPQSNTVQPCTDDYNTQLRRYFPTAMPTVGGLEGFINAKVMAEGIRRAGRELTRASFMHALESLRDYRIAEQLTLTFSPTDHQGFEQVYLTQIKNGVYVPIGNEIVSSTCVQP